MATPAERATAIFDALVDGVAPAPIKQRALDAFGTPTAFLDEIRQLVKQRITSKERRAAREALPPVVEPNLGA